jgi:YopX protein.
MNREILFRGKRADTGEWIEGYFGQSIDSFIIQDYGLVAGRFEVFKVIPETVGQYTGINDKNGRRIFEGDIIADKNELFSVRWSEKISGFVAVGEHRMQPSMNQGTMKYCEVVGNIHDNPELLESAGKDAAPYADQPVLMNAT